MLAAEGLGLHDVQVQASEIGMIASTQPACASATDLGAGCMAVVLGRPRWPDAALRARAAAAGLPLLTKPVSGAQMRALLLQTPS